MVSAPLWLSNEIGRWPVFALIKLDASEIGSFLRYQSESAWTWEHLNVRMTSQIIPALSQIGPKASIVSPIITGL